MIIKIREKRPIQKKIGGRQGRSIKISLRKKYLYGKNVYTGKATYFIPYLFSLIFLCLFAADWMNLAGTLVGRQIPRSSVGSSMSTGRQNFHFLIQYLVGRITMQCQCNRRVSDTFVGTQNLRSSAEFSMFACRQNFYLLNQDLVGRITLQYYPNPGRAAMQPKSFIRGSWVLGLINHIIV